MGVFFHFRRHRDQNSSVSLQGQGAPGGFRIEFQEFAIRRLISGGLIPNYRCPSACRHCLYRSGPRWPPDFISEETARKNFEVLKRLGCGSIHIGGGEPLLNPPVVANLLQIASGMAIEVEYVETNGAWFRNFPSACALLEDLKAAGLSTLLISISPFHNEHIPLQKVQGVIQACQKTGISIFPWVGEFLSDLSALDPSQPHSLEEYERHFGDGYIRHLPHRYWIAPGGRALETFASIPPPRPLAEIFKEGTGGCHELADTRIFISTFTAITFPACVRVFPSIGTIWEGPYGKKNTRS
jgi:hypothetical protein